MIVTSSNSAQTERKRNSHEVRETLKALSLWTEPERRIFCEQLIYGAKNYPSGGPDFLDCLQPPIDIAVKNHKLITWKNALRVLSSLLAEQGKKVVWRYCQELMQGYSTKLLGQYFTPLRVVRLALSGLKGEPHSILDPMVGHGIFLIEAHKLFPSSSLVGVDVDKLLLSNARLLLNESNNAILIEDDVFEWAKKLVLEKPDSSFSAVVGNPAYINYQNINKAARLIKPSRMNLDYKSYLLKRLKEIAQIQENDHGLQRLFREWSGYSDLATYTLLLAWLLTEPEGNIIFVLSNHWLERIYGEPLRRFLATNGTIRGIMTHRAGKWFAGAQIPTHIFFYQKGEVSDRQRKLGIPYIRIKTKHIGQDYVKNLLKDDFWDWLDSISGPKSNEKIDVYFMKRVKTPNVSHLEHVSSREAVQLPPFLRGVRFMSLEEVGWEAHQGLRTGCNEVFYLKKAAVQDGLQNSLYVAEVTRKRKRKKIPLRIPRRYLLPTIHKLPKNSGLIVREEHADRYLLNLQSFILREDRDTLNKYPQHWLEEWKINEKEIIQNELSNYLHECALMSYEGKGKPRGPVNELSAVRTNIYEPPEHEAENVPKPPRFWYQVPIRKRHFGKVIIPRVSSGPVRAFLVESSIRLIIDANFITLIPSHSRLSAMRLWLWFNANAFRVICELNGAPLGGGALKLEAATLCRIPLPREVLEVEEAVFDELARMLEKPKLSDVNLLKTGNSIDSALFGESIASKDFELVRDLICQRQTKT